MTNQKREDFINEAKMGSKSIALIYSPIELHEYLVEIITQDSNEFILNGKDLCHFNSIEDAMTQAVKYGAELFFCALIIPMMNVVPLVKQSVLIICPFSLSIIAIKIINYRQNNLIFNTVVEWAVSVCTLIAGRYNLT